MTEFNPVPPQPMAPPAKKSKVWLIVLIVVLLLLCCCCVGVGIYMYQNGDTIFQPIIEQLENSLSYMLLPLFA
jgi:flagellar basal body-associated protein FliL